MSSVLIKSIYEPSCTESWFCSSPALLHLWGTSLISHRTLTLTKTPLNSQVKRPKRQNKKIRDYSPFLFCSLFSLPFSSDNKQLTQKIHITMFAYSIEQFLIYSVGWLYSERNAVFVRENMIPAAHRLKASSHHGTAHRLTLSLPPAHSVTSAECCCFNVSVSGSCQSKLSDSRN